MRKTDQPDMRDTKKVNLSEDKNTKVTPIPMRTTAAAASAVTSAAPLVPQPNLEEQQLNMTNVADGGESSRENMADGNGSTRQEENPGNTSRTTQSQQIDQNIGNQPQQTLPAQAGALTTTVPHMAPTSVPPFPMSTADVLSAYTNAAAAGALDFNVVAGAGGSNLQAPTQSEIMSATTGPPFSGHGVPSTAVPPLPLTTTTTSTGGGTSMYHAAGFGTANVDVSASTRRLAKELEEFVERGLEGAMAAERGEPGAPSEEAIAELQLQTARRLRQLLPAHRDLLHLVQERDWIPLLLGWLNLHDQPAVQLEALLALTNITELSAQQLYYQHTSSNGGAAPVPGPAGLLTSTSGAGMTPQITADGTTGAPSTTTADGNYYSFPPPTSSGSSPASSSASSSPPSSSLMQGTAAAAAALAPMPPLTGSAGGVPVAPSPYSFSAPVPLPAGAPFATPPTFPPVPSPAPITTTQGPVGDANGTGEGDPNPAEDDGGESTTSGEPTTVFPPTSISGSSVQFSTGATGMPAMPSAFPAPGMLGSTTVPTGFGSFNPPMPSANMTTPSPSAASFEWDKAVAAANANMQNAAGAGGTLPPLSGASFPTNHLPPLPFPSADAVNAAAAAGSLVTAPSSSLIAQQYSTFPGAPAPGSGSSMFLPPAPIPSSTLGAFNGGAATGAGGIPQPLPASSQHLLLRHADAIPTLISLLSSPNREVHEQAMWILGSIAAGDSSTSGSGTGTGASGVGGGSSGGGGGVAGGSGDKSSSVAARDVVLAAGVMTPLLRCLESNPHNLSLQRIGSWALSNLVEGQFQQQSGKTGSGANSSSGNNKSNGSGIDYQSSDEIDIKTLLPTLRRLLNTADAEVLSYTCWTLSHLCDGPSSHIAAVVTTTNPTALPGGLVPRLVDLLLHPSWRVTKPALRTIGNIVCAECGDDGGASHNHGGDMCPPTTPADYTEVILECDAVPRLKHLITHSNREIQKEACWTLSNIAAGTVDQIQAVIDSGAIPPLVNLVSDKSTDQEVRSEACWVVLNATSCGSDQQIEVLVDEGCVSVLGVLLGEASMVMMALEGLERVLQVEESREMARKARLAARAALEESGEYVDDEDEKRPPTLVSASLIEKALEKHNSNAVSKRAGRIWKQHFVSCALCRESFSRHRTSDARFCNECKCHVCSNCDCRVYHLSYQEELWAATEEKTEATKRAKKSKKQKKKEKRKEKKAKQQSQEQKTSPSRNDAPVPEQNQAPKDVSVARSRSSTVTDSSDNSGSVERSGPNKPPVNELSVVGSSSSKRKSKKASRVEPSSVAANSSKTTEDGQLAAGKEVKNGKPPRNTGTTAPSTKRKNGKGNNSSKLRSKVSSSPTGTDEEDESIDAGKIRGDANGENNRQPPIDFVLYLQQTGSIIALAKLMDALEYGDGSGYDEEIDAELQMLSRQQSQQQHVLNRQATT